jgi:hypothetical protein
MYLLAVIKFPKWALKIINFQMAHFLWSDEDGNKKYHLDNWDLVSMKHEFGGLGVQNLRDFNLCLLPPRLEDTTWIHIKFGGKLWILSIIFHLIFYGLNLILVPPFGRASFGRLRLLRWGIDGN